MGRRLRMLWRVLKRTPGCLYTPPAVILLAIPAFTAMTAMTENLSEAYSVLIRCSQTFLPLCGLLWPGGYLLAWVEGDGREALWACSKGHKSLIGEMALLYGGYCLLMALGTAAALPFFPGVFLELPRVALECCFGMGTLYLLCVLFRNVLLGTIPVAMYFLFCASFSGDPELASWCLLAPNQPPEAANWPVLTLCALLGLLASIAAALLQRRKI